MKSWKIWRESETYQRHTVTFWHSFKKCVNENNEMDTILFQSSGIGIFVNTLLEGWMVGFKEVKRCNVIIFFRNTNYAPNRQIVYLTYMRHIS